MIILRQADTGWVIAVVTLFKTLANSVEEARLSLDWCVQHMFGLHWPVFIISSKMIHPVCVPFSPFLLLTGCRYRSIQHKKKQRDAAHKNLDVAAAAAAAPSAIKIVWSILKGVAAMF